MMSQVKVVDDIVNDPKYDLMFSVEEVNRLAREGMPVRDAYKKVGHDIEAGILSPAKSVNHSHEGSIGNLCNDRIIELFNININRFYFDTYHTAFDILLGK